MGGETEVYGQLLGDIKARIRLAQARAVLAVNGELVRLYWQIGQVIAGRQLEEGWGAGIIPRLARDLHNELPEEKGFSERNLKRMLAFFRSYPHASELLAPSMPKVDVRPSASPNEPGTQTGPIHSLQVGAGTSSTSIVPPAVAQISGDLLMRVPWAHHVVLMDKVKDLAHRRWYMEQVVDGGWSKNVLGLMIGASLHLRGGRSVNNFDTRLPDPQSDLVRQALKDPYIFDFMTLEEPFHERELETGLVRHMEKFLLELGQGFAFVGRQYRVDVGDEDFYIDLLFYHLKLRAFVVIDLKRGAFKPEYAGKLNFYCNVVDDRLRHETDQPTIGLILCQSKNNVLAEYALRGVSKPIGISEYELTRILPQGLESSLPTVERIEDELAQLGDS